MKAFLVNLASKDPSFRKELIRKLAKEKSSMFFLDDGSQECYAVRTGGVFVLVIVDGYDNSCSAETMRGNTLPVPGTGVKSIQRAAMDPEARTYLQLPDIKRVHPKLKIKRNPKLDIRKSNL